MNYVWLPHFVIEKFVTIYGPMKQTRCYEHIDFCPLFTRPDENDHEK